MDWTKFFGSDGQSVHGDSEIATKTASQQADGSGGSPKHNAQSIIEVAHGADAVTSGPKYKRGRGKSFFSEAPKKVGEA